MSIVGSLPLSCKKDYRVSKQRRTWWMLFLMLFLLNFDSYERMCVFSTRARYLSLRRFLRSWPITQIAFSPLILAFRRCLVAGLVLWKKKRFSSIIDSPYVFIWNLFILSVKVSRGLHSTPSYFILFQLP